MLKRNQVWKHMHKLSNKEVEKRAVMILIQHIEKIVDEIIFQGVKELDKSNQLRKIQGIDKKKRLDEYSINAAINNINLKQDISSTKIGGEKKEKEFFEKQTQTENLFMEVI